MNARFYIYCLFSLSLFSSRKLLATTTLTTKLMIVFASCVLFFSSSAFYAAAVFVWFSSLYLSFNLSWKIIIVFFYFVVCVFICSVFFICSVTTALVVWGSYLSVRRTNTWTRPIHAVDWIRFNKHHFKYERTNELKILFEACDNLIKVKRKQQQHQNHTHVYTWPHAETVQMYRIQQASQPAIERACEQVSVSVKEEPANISVKRSAKRRLVIWEEAGMGDEFYMYAFSYIIRGVVVCFDKNFGILFVHPFICLFGRSFHTTV